MWMNRNIARATDCAARDLYGKGDFLSDVLARATPGTETVAGGENRMFLEFPSDVVKETFNAAGDKTSRVYLGLPQIREINDPELATYIEEQAREAFTTGRLHLA